MITALSVAAVVLAALSLYLWRNPMSAQTDALAAKVAQLTSDATALAQKVNDQNAALTQAGNQITALQKQLADAQTPDPALQAISDGLDAIDATITAALAAQPAKTTP